MFIRQQPCSHPSSEVSFRALESIGFEQRKTFVIVVVNLSAPSKLIWLTYWDLLYLCGNQKFEVPQ